jgi:adenylate cyclase
VNVAARLEAISEPGGICISGTVRDHIGDRLDLAFDDLGEQALKNIARPVRAYRVLLATAERAPTNLSGESTPTLPLPDKPSIAVLPFANMSGDPEQEYFADGMVEEMITALSRIRWLFVIARNSSFTYKGQAIDVEVGRELGVRYVLEGSVRKAGGRVRITAQLIETATGVHLWADRFDGVLDDVFDFQDKVAISVAGVIEPALQAAETARSASRPTNDLTAYDLYLRGYAMFLSSARQIPEVLRLLEQAIGLDPRYAPALALAAVCCHRLLYDNRSEDREGDLLKGVDFARRALEVAGDDALTLVNGAFALAYFGEISASERNTSDRTSAHHAAIPAPKSLPTTAWIERCPNAATRRSASRTAFERAPRPQIGIEIGALAGGAAIAALVGCDRVKPGLGQRRHDLAPGIGDLGKAVQQQHQRPARRGIARLENMDVEAIDAADKTGADAGRQRCGFERRREHRFLPVLS